MSDIYTYIYIYILVFLLFDLDSMFHPTCYQVNIVVTLNAGMFLINGTFQKCTYSLFLTNRHCMIPVINTIFKASIYKTTSTDLLLCDGAVNPEKTEPCLTCLNGPHTVPRVAD